VRHSGYGRWPGTALGVACALISVAAHAQTAAIALHVPAEPVGQALVDFALQAKLSIGDAGLDFGSARSVAVDGIFIPQDGLRRLLGGTGYEFDILDANTVRVRARVAPPPARTEPPAVETVVVTATKREAIAQDLPYSIEVSTGRQLESTGAQTPNDLTAHVAGLTATNLGAGQDKLFVRGLSDSVLPGLAEAQGQERCDVGTAITTAKLPFADILPSRSARAEQTPGIDARMLTDEIKLVRDPLARHWLSTVFHMACEATSQFEARTAGEAVVPVRKGH
jgi:hypothetical protein